MLIDRQIYTGSVDRSAGGRDIPIIQWNNVMLPLKVKIFVWTITMTQTCETEKLMMPPQVVIHTIKYSHTPAP